MAMMPLGVSAVARSSNKASASSVVNPATWPLAKIVRDFRPRRAAFADDDFVGHAAMLDVALDQMHADRSSTRILHGVHDRLRQAFLSALKCALSRRCVAWAGSNSHWRVTAPMDRTDAVLLKRFAMRRRRIAHVTVKTVVRIERMQFQHSRIAMRLGQNRRRRVDATRPSPPMMARAGHDSCGQRLPSISAWRCR